MPRIEYIIPFNGTQILDEDEIKIEFEDPYVVGIGNDNGVHQNLTPESNSGGFNPTNDWKLNPNVECRIILEKLNVSTPFKKEYQNGRDGAEEEKTVVTRADEEAEEDNEIDPLCDWDVESDNSVDSEEAMDVTDPKGDYQDQRIIGCRYCKGHFTSTLQYELHFKKLHKPEEPYKCEVCGKTFKCFSFYDKHKLTHTGSGCALKPYQCSTSHTGFVLKSSFDKHNSKFCNTKHNLLHTSENRNLFQIVEKPKEYKCDLCNKIFLTLASFDHHNIELHSGEIRKRYTCNLCDEKFLVPHQLNAHMKIHNREQKPYKCEICGKDFLWLNSLKTHNMSHIQVQTGEKQHQQLLHNCKTCGKEFEQLSELVKHRDIHNFQGNQILLKCESCELYFDSQYQLGAHEQCHTQEKSHKCEMCGKEFIWLETLQIHRQSHSGVK